MNPEPRTSHARTAFADWSRVPGGDLLHPVAVAALLLWLVNDHLLKAAWPSFATGKISDMVSLIAFPLLCLAFWEQVRAWRGGAEPTKLVRNRVLLGAIFATGFVMVTIKLLEPAGWLYQWGLGALQLPFRGAIAILSGHEWPAIRPVELTMDPTDLLMLPALFVPWWMVAKADRQR